MSALDTANPIAVLRSVRQLLGVTQAQSITKRAANIRNALIEQVELIEGERQHPWDEPWLARLGYLLFPSIRNRYAITISRWTLDMLEERARLGIAE